jgi:hypothetical protein
MGFFDKKNQADTDAKSIENAEKIQDFVNKYKIRSRELYSKDTDDLKDKIFGSSNMGWQNYSWLSEATATSDDRAERYKDYRAMTEVPEINTSLNIYADNATQYNMQKNVMEIDADSNKVIDILEKLFLDRLDMNARLWPIVRNMCMLGDEFIEVLVDDIKEPKHVIGLERIKKPENIKRLEKNGLLLGFQYEYNDQERAPEYFQPWQIIHFKVESEKFEPYGESVLEAGRKTWKKLSLMEDAMLVYRLEHCAEHYVFYIDVGNVPTKDANRYVDDMKRQFRKKKIINPTTGEIDEKANPLSMSDQFFIPIRSGGAGTHTGTRIETLPAGANLNEIDDTKYFRDQLLKTLGIPGAYLGGNSADGAGTYDTKSYLSNQEVQFSRTIERIQKFAIKGLEKIAFIELILNHIEKADIKDYKIKLTPPSNVDQLLDMEVMNQQFALIQSIRAIENFLPDEWIYINVLGFNEQEIQKIRLQLQMQQQLQLQMGAQANQGGTDMGTGGNIMGGGVIGSGEAGGPVAPPEAGPEGGAEAPPAEGGAEPPLEVASNTIEFDGTKWLFENKNDVAKLLKYIKAYEETHRLTRPESKSHNSVTNMLLEGEFTGLVKTLETHQGIITEETNIKFGK